MQKQDTHCHLGLILSHNLSWTAHINSLLTKAQRKLSLLWKTGNLFPRFVSEKLFISYIRPQIEYGSVLYNNCTQTLKRRLDKFQRTSAIACSRAYVNTPNSSLFAELGWESLQIRRDYSKLCVMYKMVHKTVPSYLSNLVASNDIRAGYHLRHTNNLYIPLCKSEAYKNSFIPSTINQWNALHETLKSNNSISNFKCNIRKKVFRLKKNNVLSSGYGTNWVNLARIRMGMSGLKSHLFSVNIVDSPICPLCNKCTETASHYLFECTEYDVIRRFLYTDINSILLQNNLQIEPRNKLCTYLNGSKHFPYQVNQNILRSVCKFIGQSKRFI